MQDALYTLERLMETIYHDAGPEPDSKVSDLLRNFNAHCMTLKDRIANIYQELS